MPDEPQRHIFLDGYVNAIDFRSPQSVIRQRPPDRPRAAHGQHLLAQLQAVEQSGVELQAERQERGLDGQTGMTIAIEISPKNSIDYQVFEWKKDGLQVLTVIEGDESDTVAVHVPEGKLSALAERVQAYVEQQAPRSDRPKNANLVNAIANVRRAVFAELWTDEAAPPGANEVSWFQVWLRQSNRSAQETRNQFANLAIVFQIEVEPGFVTFAGRIVVAARATRSTLEEALQLLDMVAEIRSVAPTAEFFLADLTPVEQAEWIDDLRERTTVPVGPDAPVVTILDTGINNGHPLLSLALQAPDMHAVDPAWGHADHNGHGTEMAGIALYGNLVEKLGTQDPIVISHRLESVKILPPIGQNAPHLYGAVTAGAAARVEITAPARRRTFAMMTTAVGRLSGAPTEWSATIDQLAFGRFPRGANEPEDDDEEAEEVTRERLFVIAAGNVPWPDWTLYPTVNATTTVEDPAHAWNAISVGAYTTLTQIDAASYPGHSTIAPSGALSPASTTSNLFKRAWPIKPDVVAEGGNGSFDVGNHVHVGPESLRLLSTSRDLINAPLTETGDTSAATAEVSRICAVLSARYPTYWPESIRALVVHGARYSQAMRGTLPVAPQKNDKERLLRTYGYGIVDSENSEFSTTRRPTFVVQRMMQPYKVEGAAVKLGQMQLHDLPWPTDELNALYDQTVRLRITLSYFVEPNPSRRGWQSKFRYASHALRFAVKAASETPAAFLQRVNKLERDVDSDDKHPDPDGADWTFGSQLRSRGSIHSDIWTGTATKLASKSQIAVFPVGGWWKDWKEAAQFDTETRYSLVVSLEVAENVEADIYTPITNKIAAAAIGVPVVIDVPNE